MATLNKALNCLFENAAGRIPAENEIEEAVSKVFAQLRKTAAEDDPSAALRSTLKWKDLYLFFQKHVEGGASAKSIDRLFGAIDVNHTGSVSEAEFAAVVLSRYQAMREEKALDEKLAKRVPRIHVVPGSNRLNAMSNTNAFRVEVVNRGWLLELGATWAELDSDNDGMVQMSDLKRYFSRIKPHLLQFIPSIFRAVDRERCGKITFKQFLKALFPEASQTDLKTLMAMARTRNTNDHANQADDKLLQEILGVFKVYDDDRSGQLDLEEFVSAMELTGHTEAESSLIFKVVDKDGSGTVSFDEFSLWYTHHYAQFMADQQRRILDEDEDATETYA